MASSERKDSFTDLTQDLILDSVEATGMRCTGRVLQLNSMENRVYAVEVENEEGAKPTQVIAKFYRPGRWTTENLLSEHAMQRILSYEHISTPKFIPISRKSSIAHGDKAFSHRLKSEFRSLGNDDVSTLGRVGDFYFCVWEKIIGRSPLELKREHLEEVGTLVARMHNLFESQLNPDGFARHSLSTAHLGYPAIESLIAWGKIPRPFDTLFLDLAARLVKGLEWVDDCIDFIPIHGDLHRLNLLQTREAGDFWVVDFDDCMWGPEIHDLWLLASGASLPVDEGEDATDVALQALIDGYSEFRILPEGSQDLVEPLRTLRMIYYFGWIAGRWYDPLFRDVFSFFNDPGYWERSYNDLEIQRDKLQTEGLLDITW